jgi:hypothetical protein
MKIWTLWNRQVVRIQVASEMKLYMNGISNDASQHHPTEQGSVKQSRTTKENQKRTFPYLKKVLKFLKTPLTNLSVILEAHLKNRQKRPIRGKRRRGKNIINIKG